MAVKENLNASLFEENNILSFLIIISLKVV